MAILEDTRAIVDEDETFEGKIIPTVQSEIGRTVTVHDGATVTEGIYGETVTVESGAVVEGSVMASDAVTLAGGEVQGGVGTPGKVEGEGAHVHSTVTGTRIRLVDCVVRGNVVGAEIILEDCTVLGLVVGERSLRLDGCLCHTFKSYMDATVEDTEVVLPQAVVDGSLDLRTPVGVAGIGPEEGVDAGAGTVTLTEQDLVEQEGTRYLTLADRVLNLERVRDQIAEVEDQLRAAVIEGATDADRDLSRLGIDSLPAPGEPAAASVEMETPDAPEGEDTTTTEGAEEEKPTDRESDDREQADAGEPDETRADDDTDDHDPFGNILPEDSDG